MKKTKNILLPLLAALVFCSCKDKYIAEKIVGTWKYSYVTTYDDGTKSHQEEFVTFRKDSQKEGGSFTEISTGQEEFDEEDVTGTYNWESRIEGTWEIRDGDLYQHYNLSTLEVQLDKDNVDFHLNRGNMLFYDFDVAVATSVYYSQNLHKELKKDTYKNLFDYYKKQNAQDKEGACFMNVQVDEDVLSFETNDEILEYMRIREDTCDVPTDLPQ